LIDKYMNQPTGYSQFIYGKFIDRNSGYGLVARTADLIDEDELEDKVEKTHSFWNQAPSGRSKGVGVFREGENVVFAQFARALDEQGTEVASGGSPFYQHRYIFIPAHVLDSLHHHTPLIFASLSQQRIPLFSGSELHRNLPPFQLPPCDDSLPGSEIPLLWHQTDAEEIPLLLSALALLLNHRRLLLTRERGTEMKIIPEIFLENVLALLPAACRSQIGVAIGTIEEEYCPWAQLMVKHSSPDWKLLDNPVSNLVWLDLINKKFEGMFSPQDLKHPYVEDTLLPLDTQEAIARRLNRLDQMTDPALSLETLTQSEWLVGFISELPPAKQIEQWQKYIPGIRSERWEALLSTLENQPLLNLWKALEALTPANQPQTFVPQLLLVWKKLLLTEQVKLLDDYLKVESLIPEQLLNAGLLNLPHYQSIEVAAKLRSLCQRVVANRAKQNLDLALALVDFYDCEAIFNEGDAAFQLLDAAFLEPRTEDLLNANVIRRLPTIHFNQWVNSNLSRAVKSYASKKFSVLERLIRQQPNALNDLMNLLAEKQLSLPEQDQIIRQFLEVWALPIASVRSFLKRLLEKSINSFKLTTGNFPEVYSWFTKQDADLEQTLETLEHHPDPDVWQSWLKIAKFVCETPEAEIKFLDQAVGQRFGAELLQQWLLYNLPDDPKVEQLSPETWASLTPELIHHTLVRQPQTASALIQAFAFSHRPDLIQGDPIHYLTQDWIAHQSASPYLLKLISSPSIESKLSQPDRQMLQRASWKIGANLKWVKLPFSSDEKRLLHNMAIDIIQEAISIEHGLTILRDCSGWGLDTEQQNVIATKLMKRCEQPNQVRQLMEVCDDLGFDSDSKQIVLHHVKPGSCEIDLVLPYLRERQTIDLVRDRELLLLLLKAPTAQETDRKEFRAFTSRLFQNQIVQSVSDLQWWRDQANDQQLYEDAFRAAIEQRVADSDFQFKSLREHARILRNALLNKESNVILKAMQQQIEAEHSR